MTEVRWMACINPVPMLRFCMTDAWNARKERLFAAACCRLIWNALTEWDRRAVEVSERYADGQASEEEFKAISFRHLRGWLSPVGRVVAAARTIGQFDPADWATHFAQARLPTAKKASMRVAATFIREVYGNPFRPVNIDPGWLTPTVTSLATEAYEERSLPSGELDPACLGVLADALEDAGCAGQQILDHLRGPGPHVRGCWAMDAIIAKE